MKLPDLPPARHPLWRLLGFATLGLVLAMTSGYMLRNPRSLSGAGDGGDPALFSERTRGSIGTLTEQLGPNRMVLDYKTIAGSEEDLRLEGVTGRMTDQGGQWRMTSPTALRRNGVWTLMSPMDLRVDQPGTSQVLGEGTVQGTAPALQWQGGFWEGLAPLHWETLQGPGQGTWDLPAGWQREPEGRIRVDHGPVVWQAPRTGVAPATLLSMEAGRLWAMPGFQTGRLEQVLARLTEGSLQATAADLSPDRVVWPGPLAFERRDGWRGEAEGGWAPRPAPGSAFQQVELRGFRARRALPAGTESLASAGVRWTPAGLRLEGSVVWDQPLDGQRLTLKAPRVLIREGEGADLPSSLPKGFAVAEGQAVLQWGGRSLSSPRILVQRTTRAWRLQGPVYGRGEDGTFSSGAGSGDPRSWVFLGPVQVNPTGGGSLRGSQLVWQDERWTLTGQPAAWARLRERLSGPRIVRQGAVVAFPEGLNGTLAAPDGDVSVRAEEGQSEAQRVVLGGGVTCRGQGWSLSAQNLTVWVNPDRSVRLIQAQGGVSLRGRLGEGQGDALELEPGPRVVRWQGRVRGRGAGPSW
ncbi:MAG TPA: hypothetical protein VF768_11205 [Holophagaceae bacterium]